MRLHFTPEYEEIFAENYPIVKTAEYAVCKALGVSLKAMRSRTRVAHVVFARVIFVHICANIEDPLTHLGSYLHKDHSTIIHYQRIFDSLIEYNQGFRNMMQRVENELNKQTL